MNNVTIVGAGLSGCEAALQLASQGYNIKLFDLKPKEIIEPYKYSSFSELICNNSIGNISKKTATGLLLNELKIFGSKIIGIAEDCRINDPNFLAVDKKNFSNIVSKELYKHNINIVCKRIVSLPNDDIVIIATGPITNELLVLELTKKFGIDTFYFYDSSSPVIDIRTIDIDSNNIQKITDDLYAIIIPNIDFQIFYEELLKNSSENINNNIDKKINYEKCQSIEQLAKIGINELYLKRFKNDYTDKPCLLLRRENALENGFIMVGCMTALRNSAQHAVFSKIPCLKKCTFIKYGRMHRNTFLDAPKYLNEFFQIKGTNTFIIGQLSGVDGYAPSIASGMVAALRIIYGNKLPSIPTNTMIGGLARYISNSQVIDYQPMCASFSLIDKQKNDTSEILLKYISNLRNL